jgi:arginyl-tRNA synthetase
VMYHGEIEKSISFLLEKSAKAVFAGLNIHPPHFPEIKAEIEIPKEKSHGDLSTNIAMRASKIAKKPPVEFAELLKPKLEAALSASELRDAVERIEIKHPGFMNFHLSKSYLAKVLLEIKRKKNDYGRSSIGRGVKLQVEFVSANPTGPLTIAHGRQAAIGDSLANILQFLGYKVTREYYLNDEGNQINILGASIRARYLDICGVKEEFPADGYKGSYILDIAKVFKKRYGKRFVKAPATQAAFREFGLRWILNDIKKDLKAFGVKFDVWYSQKSLRKSGKVDKTMTFLREKGYIYEKEGAVWFKSTSFGDDKDRVVYKSDGSATYLTPDIAYHLEKYRRGFKRLVDIWGPDHHGYVPRMKAAIKALGFQEDSLAVLIVQLATLYRHGQVVSMSTRAGEFITLREVMDEVGKDVSRFCFIMRRISSHLDFDLDAVKKASMENPVYYIQYAHARIWSILSRGRSLRVSAKFDSTLLKESEELEIMRMLRQFPLIVNMSGKTLEPYVVLQYLQELATVFHSFYTKHKVLCDDPSLARSRLVLVDCVRIVLANGLRLLGVSLPKKM